MSGRDFWHTKSCDRIGLKSMRLSDGPTGLRSIDSRPATVFPVATALAASWNRALVAEVGATIGSEARDHGVDVLLAPGLNLHRSPLGGRNFEYYSEDPYLSGHMAAAFIQGVQSRGVGACAKHFVANNQETDRMSMSADIDLVPLREVYLKGFEIAVAEGRPWTVMTAYNRVNGTFCSQHETLLQSILRDAWGFDGLVMSDWMGAHSGVDCARAGLDLEMPGPGRIYTDALVAAVEAGHVSESVIDASVGRLLTLAKRCGKLGASGPRANPPEAGADVSARSRDVARKAAGEGIVLLRNANGLLPLSEPSSIAIIGMPAQSPALQGGGSSQVVPERIVTPLEAIRSVLPDETTVTYHRGVDIETRPAVLDRALLKPVPGSPQTGLKADYFTAADLSGSPLHSEVDAHLAKIGFGAVAQSRHDPGFGVRWSGVFTPRYSGRHTFVLRHSNPSVRFVLDGATLLDDDTSRATEMLFMILPLHVRTATVDLEAGQSYAIVLEYRQDADDGVAGFNIFNVGLAEPKPDPEVAIAAAKAADACLLFAGQGQTAHTEGKDLASNRLDPAQTEMIERILEANPKTVVILNTAGPVELPWVDRASAVLHSWLPGQEGASALADILVGQLNPSGRLPMTYGREPLPHHAIKADPDGAGIAYEEGHALADHTPDDATLFPFGHGLSYSDWTLSNVRAFRRDGGGLLVKADVTNLGPFDGATVVQVYHKAPSRAGRPAPRKLVAFRKVYMKKNSTHSLSIRIDEERLRSYVPTGRKWTLQSGPHNFECLTEACSPHHVTLEL
ncbi:MAG: glycoside hydrolase family 3 protein [Litorimonas sp.]